MTQLFNIFFKDLQGLIYPNNCVICNSFIEGNKNSICGRCFNKIEPTWLEDWKDKLTFSEGIDEVYSAWFTTGSISDIIHNVKYYDQPKLGMELGRRMAQEFPIDELGEIDIITAVPLNTARKRERGYNQAAWIAKGLSQSWNVPCDFTILSRTKNTHTQTDLNADERKDNINQAFKSLKLINGLSIAIVDDVITTGATTSECAKVLKKNGTAKVTAVSCCTPYFDY